MKHLFVPYEIALQLKEKGFDDYCVAFMYLYENSVRFTLTTIMNNNSSWLSSDDKSFISAPLYQQVIDWFREKHDIVIEVTSYYNPHKLDKKLYECALSHKDNGFEGLMQNASNRISVDWTTNSEQYNLFGDYYKALNHILQEALKLI